MHDFNQNTSKKEGSKSLSFSQELQKDKSFQAVSRPIHLEGWE